MFFFGNFDDQVSCMSIFRVCEAVRVSLLRIVAVVCVPIYPLTLREPRWSGFYINDGCFCLCTGKQGFDPLIESSFSKGVFWWDYVTLCRRSVSACTIQTCALNILRTSYELKSEHQPGRPQSTSPDICIDHGQWP